MPLRFAVLGLYNSGSTTLAGMLHRLGANLGPPFWRSDDDASPHNYYEPHDLSSQLRSWWAEPDLIEQATAAVRRDCLRHWIKRREGSGAAPVGAKHPLLSLCGSDLLEAWGPATRIIWAWREFDDSVRGLVRRQWFRGREAALQQRLWDALHTFEQAQHGVVRVNWHDVRAEPAAAARRLAEATGLVPTTAQLAAAAGFVRTEASDAMPPGIDLS